MAFIKISLRNNTKKKLESLLQQAKYKGDVHTITKVLVILAVATAQHTYELISRLFKVSTEFIRLLITNFIIKGIKALKPKQSQGRKPKLTKS